MQKWKWPSYKQLEEDYAQENNGKYFTPKAKRMWNKENYKEELKGIQGSLGRGKIMFVGLNPNTTKKKHKFDHKNMYLYFNLKKYGLEDSLLTDLFQNSTEPTQKEFLKKLKTLTDSELNKKLMNDSQDFFNEYNPDIHKKIFCFGKLTKKFMEKLFNLKKIQKPQIKEIFHYAANTANKPKTKNKLTGYIKIQNYTFKHNFS